MTGSSTQDTTARLLDFLEQRTRRAWQPSDDLFATGGVTSLFALELVVYVEQAYDITIGGADLSLDNFRTVDAIVALVDRLRAATVPGDAGS